MSAPRTILLSLSLGIFLLIAAILPIHAQSAAAAPSAPDATLYTSYFFSTGYKSVTWIVCGSTADTEGCYGSGSLGPFGQAGALIEGNPVVNSTTNTVTRLVYIVDSAAGSGTSVSLYVYKETDVVTSESDTTTFTLERTVSLPLTGGAGVITLMAANSGYLFIGTNQSTLAVRVQKSNSAVVQIGGFSPPIPVSSITADKYGYVTVTFGSSIESSGENGFYQFGPDGSSVGDGGGAWFMLSTDIGLTTTTLPTTDVFPAEKLVVKPKNSPTANSKQ